MLTVVSTTLLDWYHVVFSIRWMIKVINKSTLRCSQKLNSEISEISLFKHSPPQSCSFVDRLQVSACVLLTFARRCVTLYNMRWMGVAVCAWQSRVDSYLTQRSRVASRRLGGWGWKATSAAVAAAAQHNPDGRFQLHQLHHRLWHCRSVVRSVLSVNSNRNLNISYSL